MYITYIKELNKCKCVLIGHQAYDEYGIDWEIYEKNGDPCDCEDCSHTKIPTQYEPGTEVRCHETCECKPECCV